MTTETNLTIEPPQIRWSPQVLFRALGQRLVELRQTLGFVPDSCNGYGRSRQLPNTGTLDRRLADLADDQRATAVHAAVPVPAAIGSDVNTGDATSQLLNATPGQAVVADRDATAGVAAIVSGTITHTQPGNTEEVALIPPPLSHTWEYTQYKRHLKTLYANAHLFATNTVTMSFGANGRHAEGNTFSAPLLSEREIPERLRSQVVDQVRIRIDVRKARAVTVGDFINAHQTIITGITGAEDQPIATIGKEWSRLYSMLPKEILTFGPQELYKHILVLWDILLETQPEFMRHKSNVVPITYLCYLGLQRLQVMMNDYQQRIDALKVANSASSDGLSLAKRITQAHTAAKS